MTFAVRPVEICSSKLERLHYSHMRRRSFVSLELFNTMKLFLVYLSLVIKVIDIQASDNLNLKNTVNDDPVYNYMEDVEVPDTPLLLFDRLNLRKLSAVAYFARQNQGVSLENSTLTSSSRPCSCNLGVCKCCTGYVLDLFNQKACMKVTYHPGDFAFDVAMSMNDRILYENSLSGKNPRPICISPPRLSNLKVCARFYNVFFPGRNFHFCLAMTGMWRSVELFNIAFDCLRMGANGMAMVKPDEAGGLPIPNPQGGVDAVIDEGDDDIEDYDENLVRSLFDMFDDRK